VESSIGLNVVRCDECGRIVDKDSYFCQYCGDEIVGDEDLVAERRSAEEEKSFMPVLGGILMVVSAFFVFWTIVLINDYGDRYMGDVWLLHFMGRWPDWSLIVLGFFGVAAILGGVSAIMRKSQVAAVFGGMLSVFGLGFPIGLVGLLMVAVSGDKFESRLSDLTEMPEEIEEGGLQKSALGWRRT